MRIATVLALSALLLGGFVACNDHNPKVVFPTDAGSIVKLEAGASQDLGADRDTVAVAALVLDGGAQEADASTEVSTDANRGPDAPNLLDVKGDTNVTIDGATSVDGAGSAVLDVGVDSAESSAAIDGGKVGG
jgi:hypothetical protein